jgi:hypothetical protein
MTMRAAPAVRREREEEWGTVTSASRIHVRFRADRSLRRSAVGCDANVESPGGISGRSQVGSGTGAPV